MSDRTLRAGLGMIPSTATSLIVIPAQAGIHLDLAVDSRTTSKIKMDPGLRRDDEINSAGSSRAGASA